MWSAELRVGAADELAETVAGLEQAGFDALWLPGRSEDVFDVAGTYLAATDRLAVATGIVSIWSYVAEEAGRSAAALNAAHGGRFLLGLGVSHAPLVDTAEHVRWRRPVELMARYLDALDHSPGAGEPRLLAALGPRMLDLSGARTTGTHPYLVPPEHTAFARERLGPGPLIAVCQTVTLSAGSDAARLLRGELANYLRFPNYVDNWRRFGITDDDLAGGGSDRLLGFLFAQGSDEAAAERVRAHRAAGADHVCVKVVVDPTHGPPIAEWRRLAAVLADPST